MIFACLLIFNEKKTILKINQIRIHNFWIDLTEHEKHIKIPIYSHYLLWFLISLLYCTLIYRPYLPIYVYNENWPFLVNFIVIINSYFLLLFGHYVAISHECFYAHSILHGYFQIKTVSVYLQKEFRKYKNNQKQIENVLLCCIKQHEILTM